MARPTTIFHCTSCGDSTPKWLGKCPACGAWNTLVEDTAPTVKRGSPLRRSSIADGAARPITEVSTTDAPRLLLEMGELDRVLGGGLVKGALVLVGGEPGIGKSTLLLGIAGRLASRGSTVLYVSGEESAPQTRMRAERIGALKENILLLCETDLARIESVVEKTAPAALIVDSVQTMTDPLVDSVAGSVSQVRAVCARLLDIAKQRGIAIFLVGHVTKDGAIAGPKTLEHMVDTVLSFESARGGPYRMLRSTKNRFGSTHELAVFEMRSEGLVPVDNPSAVFLAERPKGRPGSAVAAAIEGTRPLLVEIQALCVDAPFGSPRRTTLGVDSTRTALLSAVLDRRCGLSLAGMDLFVNVAGGISLEETAADLPVALAIASSLRGVPIDAGLVCFGEVGLGGEIRGVVRPDERLQEAQKLGFTRALVPLFGSDRIRPPAGIALLPVSSLEEAIDTALATS
jgi:DNA repair protein RadA/Sms